MCINCNLLTPLTDLGADVLGVPRRTFLVVGYTTHHLFTDDVLNAMRKDLYAGFYSNAVFNVKTCDFIEVPDDIEEVVVNGVSLYKGRLHPIGPLPLEYKPAENVDLYPELFDEPIEWVTRPPVPPSQARLPNALANKYVV